MLHWWADETFPDFFDCHVKDLQRVTEQSLISTWCVVGHFEDKPLQEISCSGTDNLIVTLPKSQLLNNYLETAVCLKFSTWWSLVHKTFKKVMELEIN